ncbi:hypothetical protein [Aureibacillus halotolerans]|uniref:DUF4367 domain-containing protein n=1 Tax=Aureibacillus halotolerans TaxID=1508390 RepID=A0A4R6TZK5_9BACI|nr:hypothetical protein [Aureibacillus halotolerans]TDQ39071.1 hypothetical protein EV213_10817 [Aureibacillus halotolerans]
MNVISKGVFTLCIFSCLLLAACSVSEEDALQSFEDTIQNAVESPVQEVNYTTDSMSFYKPEAFSVNEEDQYNVVLEDAGQLFILFANPFSVESNTKVNEQADFYSDSIKVPQSETELKVNVIKEDDTYLVTFQHGDMKISTETNNPGDLSKYAEQMISIIKSSKYL